MIQRIKHKLSCSKTRGKFRDVMLCCCEVVHTLSDALTATVGVPCGSGCSNSFILHCTIHTTSSSISSIYYLKTHTNTQGGVIFKPFQAARSRISSQALTLIQALSNGLAASGEGREVIWRWQSKDCSAVPHQNRWAQRQERKWKPQVSFSKGAGY